MEQINKVILRGTVGQCKTQTVQNTTIGYFSLATNYAYFDKDKTPCIETTWHRIRATENGKTISNLDSISKGDTLEIEGRLRVYNYTAMDGESKTGIEIIAGKVIKIDNENSFAPQRENI